MATRRIAAHGPLFDAYLIVDWSANSKPKTGKDSVWYFLLRRTRGGEEAVGPHNLSTRRSAEDAVRELLDEQAASGSQTLVGFDFPYGYPRGLAGGLGLAGPPWRAVWDELLHLIEDDEHNRNNRFEVASELNRRLGEGPGPFWACPPSQQTKCLSVRKPQPWCQRFEELRLTDHAARAQSPWKLYTAGSAGSQALLGIPSVARLRGDPHFGSASRVWPFETGLRAPDFSGYSIVHAEIYPSLIAVKAAGDAVKDALQVEALARHFARKDEAGEIAGLFDGPASLTPQQRNRVEGEEGWILGVGAKVGIGEVDSEEQPGDLAVSRSLARPAARPG